MRKPFIMRNEKIEAGTTAVVDLPTPKLNSHTSLYLPVHVVHGRRTGPTLFISAAIHGDELNGIEIIRRVLAAKALSRLRGTLLAVPVVNPYGLIHHSRYLPDRRDLNRSFPGSGRGSLAARLADLFLDEIVKRSDFGVDLHTGAIHRSNLPQIRADLGDPTTARLAHAFGVPVLLNATIRDGSLRAAAGELGIPVLLYEAGEALRYDRMAIRAGYQGVMNVLRALDMLPATRRKSEHQKPFVARSSRWLRAPESGMLRTSAELGSHVVPGDILGQIDDPYSGASHKVISRNRGVVIGKLELPIVHEGDALYHIARFRGDAQDVADHVELFQRTDELNSKVE